jgi:hypothetical protein
VDIIHRPVPYSKLDVWDTGLRLRYIVLEIKGRAMDNGQNCDGYIKKAIALKKDDRRIYLNILKTVYFEYVNSFNAAEKFNFSAAYVGC